MASGRFPLKRAMDRIVRICPVYRRKTVLQRDIPEIVDILTNPGQFADQPDDQINSNAEL
jgi:hypothetical protein